MKKLTVLFILFSVSSYALEFTKMKPMKLRNFKDYSNGITCECFSNKGEKYNLEKHSISQNQLNSQVQTQVIETDLSKAVCNVKLEKLKGCKFKK